SHQLPDLLRDVGQEVLHEPREIASGCSDEQVQVVRCKDEREELDLTQLRRARQYTAQDVIGLGRRTHQETALEATHRHEIDLQWIEHPQWPAHGFPPCSRRVTSTNWASEGV